MERTSSGTYQIAVLSSGHSRGSNLKAMHRYWKEHSLPIQIGLAVFTLSDSPALAVAKDLGIASIVMSAKQMNIFETEVLERCKAKNISLIALAGFMKQLSADFITKVGIPILNIHPALLPQYGGKGMYGMAVHRAVYAGAELVSGATVHLVDPLYDHGKIVAQSKINISECTSPEEIAASVLAVEHQLYAVSIYQLLAGVIH
ncbi:MAG: formyltransferase family protein [Candidatus Cloacimonetes bacterium]|nr:formyltransferase family protein [Candidatus Cloacimonadota bacterium]